MQANYVYRAPPQYRSPQVYRFRPYQPYTLGWLYNRATQQYVVLDEPGGGWDAQAVPYGQSPATVDGDILVAPLITSPGSYLLTLNADGILSVDTGGDSSRQLMLLDIYDTSLAAFYGAATFAVNDQAPAADPLPDTVALQKDDAMATQDLAAQFNDPELDPLAFAITSGSAPTGTSVDSAGQWTGTPTVAGTGSFVLTATDPYGATGTLTVDWSVVDQVSVPNVLGMDAGAAEAELAAAFLLVDYTDPAYSSLYDAGEIAVQSPAATTVVDIGDTVTLTVSLGVAAGTGILLTTFLDDSTPVPASASYLGGSAYAQDGTRYVALWPANDKVAYRGPFAHRADGALLIATSGNIIVTPVGVAMTARGEVRAAQDTPAHTHNGWPLTDAGIVCMSDIAA